MNQRPPAPFNQGEIAAALAAVPAMFQAEVQAMPETVLRWRPAVGEWCVLEILGHLIEAEERGFAGRIRAILAAEQPTFATWDPNAVALARKDHRRDPAPLLAEFIAVRTASVDLVAGLTQQDLQRSGDHPAVGRLTVQDLLHEWIHHDRNHVRQVLANVREYVWPNLGGAQRFSGLETSGVSQQSGDSELLLS